MKKIALVFLSLFFVSCSSVNGEPENVAAQSGSLALTESGSTGSGS